jgi:hypothetical protein
MKSILSLILPDNEGKTISRRYLKEGRKAIGFQDKQLVTALTSGVEQGINAITADDLSANITTDAGTVSKRVTIFSGRTAATAATIPSPSGELRELLIMNANTSSGAVTLATNPVTTAYGAHASPLVVAINTPARFLSNGSNWYRVG